MGRRGVNREGEPQGVFAVHDELLDGEVARGLLALATKLEVRDDTPAGTCLEKVLFMARVREGQTVTTDDIPEVMRRNQD